VKVIALEEHVLPRDIIEAAGSRGRDRERMSSDQTRSV